MGSALATDTIPILVTMVDVHNVRAQDQFYFANVSTGGASTKVIGRSQTLSVEVSVNTVLRMTVYECPEYLFTPEYARCLGCVQFPIERLAERYSSGIFQQWFNLDCHADSRGSPSNEPAKVASMFEQSYQDACDDVYQPKVCVSIIGSAFEVQPGGRELCSIFVGEDVKTQAGPDLKALIASHKQQSSYIDALHEELRKLKSPSYRPAHSQTAGVYNPHSATPGNQLTPPTAARSIPSMMAAGYGNTDGFLRPVRGEGSSPMPIRASS